MPDTMGHAVGVERFELLARAAGNEVRWKGLARHFLSINTNRSLCFYLCAFYIDNWFFSVPDI